VAADVLNGEVMSRELLRDPEMYLVEAASVVAMLLVFVVVVLWAG
jgi:hypothetical protein